MRIVVVGASGNVGTAVLRALRDRPEVDEIVGVARRVPPRGSGTPYDAVTWHSIDISAAGAAAALADVFARAAVVIHLAWQIQPSHDRIAIRDTNVDGSARVAEAVVRAGVPAVVYASSVGAYAPGPKDRRVDESWPVTGVRSSTYSRDKADVEAMLDQVERDQPWLRVVRLRPGLTFQRDAASEIARLFIGPLVPTELLRLGRLPVVPSGPALRVQAVHADDVAEAYALAALSDVRGPFNIVAEPVLDARSVGPYFHGVGVKVPPSALRAAANLTWRARLQPTEPGWVDLAVRCPLLDAGRAERELGWRARTDAITALAELFDAMARRRGTNSPALHARPGPVARIGAMLTGRLPGHGNPY